jgi:hypothetical protein
MVSGGLLNLEPIKQVDFYHFNDIARVEFFTVKIGKQKKMLIFLETLPVEV